MGSGMGSGETRRDGGNCACCGSDVGFGLYVLTQVGYAWDDAVGYEHSQT
jgi:hypothetical protein